MGFGRSNFKRTYAVTGAPSQQHQLLGAVHDLLKLYCARHGFAEAAATAFFDRLQSQAFTNAGELLTAVQHAAQRMWTSTLVLEDVDTDYQKELCSILNEVLRADTDEAMRHLCIFVRAINQLLVTRRPSGSAVRFPTNGMTYRGGVMPVQHFSFFTV